jgi:adenosylcobinamide kinase/adenosylcobinamide-phosphate guanylyltransferase
MNEPAIAPKQLILVTGPARSGKSEWAETLAVRSEKSVIYIATARVDPADGEWQTRIEKHKNRRPSNWTTEEVPVELSEAIATYSHSDSCILLDSLGTWVANLLETDEAEWQKQQQVLLESLSQARGDVILVAEETGWGVVPAFPVGRLFRDRLGSLVRLLGAIANPVYLVAGGHVLNLSALGSPLTKS